MIVKKHKTADNRLILSLCDEKLLGKIFSQGDLQLDLTSDFFKGEKMDEEKINLFLKQAFVINAVGEKSVDFCYKAGIFNKENINKIECIPHAQIVRF